MVGVRELVVECHAVRLAALFFLRQLVRRVLHRCHLNRPRELRHQATIREPVRSSIQSLIRPAIHTRGFHRHVAIRTRGLDRRRRLSLHSHGRANCCHSIRQSPLLRPRDVQGRARARTRRRTLLH